LVPDEVQWVSQNRGCCLAQRQSMVAHRPGDPVIHKQAVGQREDQSKPWLFTSRITGLSPLAPPFTQSSALPQMACAPEACDSRRVPACARAP
jgi:hypothetical protein